MRDPHGWRRGPDTVGAGTSAALALAVGFLSLRFWEWRPGVPVSVVGDAPLVLTQVDEIVRHGWFWSNAQVGFPLGQNASFFPELDVVHVIGVKLLGLLGAGPATASALYFLLGWPLVAVTTYLLARSERLRAPAAVVVAVLFAAAPYHAERFEHLWLASYWTLPLAIWVVLAVLRGTGPFDPGVGGSRPRRVLQVVALVLVGMSGAYYAGFTVILLVAALVLRAGSGRSRGWWRGGLVSAAVVGAVAAVPLFAARVGMSGTVLTGPRPATRSPLESERYAGRVIDLVLPWEGHRIDALASLTATYQAAGKPVPETLALGAVGLVGAVALLVVGLQALATRRVPVSRLAVWSALAVVAGLFYTAGGLGSVVALFATPQLRTWSRFSLVILLLGLLAVGHWLDRRRARLLGSALACGVLVVGVLDQTNPRRAPDYVANAARMDDLRTYTEDLTRATGGECGVLQLPVMRFPEGVLPTGYDINAQLLPHLVTRSLSFSHGGMSGTRAGDWPLGLELSDPTALVTGLRAAGFCAVEVDTAGVALDEPAVARLTGRLGEPVARTPDSQRFLAWALPEATGSEADRERLLSPVLVGLASGALVVDDDTVSQEGGPRSGLTTANLSDRPVTGIAVSVSVTSLGSPSREVVVRDGTRELARVTAVAGRATPMALTLTAPVGYQRLTIEVEGDPVRNAADRSVSVRFTDLTVTAPGTTRVVSLHDQARTGAIHP